MSLVTVATWLALATTSLAAALSAGALADRRLGRWADRALVAALVATALPLALLAVAFLGADLSLFYVWQNMHTTSPWWLRLAGLWGGQQGTFLLWAGVVLGASCLERRWASDAMWPRVRVVLTVLAALLVLPPVLLGLGQLTGEMGLTSGGDFAPGGPGPGPLSLRPDGQGLNPLLDSPYMAIHPPVEFLAYGLTAVVFAYGLVSMASGGRWQEATRRWGRAAWLAFAVALSLGGLWAYLVLSFGGYWAWDPVEVADLLPFLALTVLLHAGPVSRRSGHLDLLARSMATFAFVLVVLATFVTRAGLWSSVHAFLPTGVQIAIEDPGARLSSIIATDLVARYTTGLLLLVGGLFPAAASLYQARARPQGSLGQGAWGLVAGLYALVGVVGLVAPEPVTGLLHGLALVLGAGNVLAGIVGLLVLGALPLLAGLWISPEDTPVDPSHRTGQLVLAAYALTLTLLATLVLLLLGVNGYDQAVFEARAPFIAGPVLGLVLIAFHPGSTRAAWATLAAATAVGLGLKLVTGAWSWAAAPLALAAAAGPVWRLAQRAYPTGGPRARARALLLAGAGLLGLVHWASPGTVVVGGLALASPAWYVPVGLAASLLALVWPFLEERGPAWLGPALGVLAIGYGVGGLMAVVAWWLERERVPGPRAPLASAGVPLIHLAVCLLVLGVAVSTYGQAITTVPQSAPLERGQPLEVGPYTLELVGGQVVDDQAPGPPRALEAVVHVSKDGAFLAERTLRLEHSFNVGFTASGGYVPADSPTVRTWEGDVQLDVEPAVPLSMRVQGDQATWVTANAAPPAALEGQIDAVSLGIARTPAVNLVWGALVLLVGGLVARVVPRRWTTASGRHRAARRAAGQAGDRLR